MGSCSCINNFSINGLSIFLGNSISKILVNTKWYHFYTGNFAGTKPWQNKVAQTVASGIAAGILSGGTAVINHIADTLKAKGVGPAQISASGSLTNGNGGGNKGGTNGGAGQGVSSGGKGGSNASGFPQGNVVYIGSNSQSNNNNAGVSGGSTVSNGAQQGTQLGASGKGGDKENLGTTYVFTGVNGNAVPTVSGTQRQVRKPDNNLLFSGAEQSNNKNKEGGMTYKFQPISKANNMVSGSQGEANGMHGILIPPHGTDISMVNVHKEGRHMTPIEASENIGSVLNELISMIPHENYNINTGIDDIHVQPPSISSSIMTAAHGGIDNLHQVHNNGMQMHGSRQKLIHDLAEIQSKAKIGIGKQAKGRTAPQLKNGKGKQNIGRYDDDSDEDEDEDDDFDIDKDKEDNDEKENDTVPGDDEKKAEDIQNEKNEKEVANGKDLEEVFDELEDREDAKAATDHLQQKVKSNKQTKQAKAQKSTNIANQIKSSLQGHKSSLLQKAITRRQQYLLGSDHSERINKNSQLKHNYEVSGTLPVEIKDSWPGTLSSKRTFKAMGERNHVSENMIRKGYHETSNNEKEKVSQDKRFNNVSNLVEYPKITYISATQKDKFSASSHTTKLYDEDVLDTKEKVKTKEIARKHERGEIIYDDDGHDDKNGSEGDGNTERKARTKEIEKRNQIARIAKSSTSKNESEKEKDERTYRRDKIKDKSIRFLEQRGEILADDLSWNVLHNANLAEANGRKRGKVQETKVTDFGKSINEEADDIEEELLIKRDYMNKHKNIKKMKEKSGVGNGHLKDNDKMVSERHKNSSNIFKTKTATADAAIKTRLKKKQEYSIDGEKRSIFNDRKEIANMAVKAFLPVLMNRIQHKIESKQAKNIYAYYPYEANAVQSTINTNKPYRTEQSLHSGLTFALLRNMLGGQASNHVQQQPQIINRLNYPVYFIPPVTQGNPPVLSIGPQPAFVPPLPVQRPPVASIGPESPLSQQPPQVFPPVASIGPEPFFRLPEPTNQQKPVLSIAKDPKPLPTKSPSVKAAPVKPSPTGKKGKDKNGKARHITPSMKKESKRYGPTESSVQDYDTQSSMHHHSHYHHFEYGRPHEMHWNVDHEMHEPLPHGTEPSVHNTIPVGQGVHGDYDEHRFFDKSGAFQHESKEMGGSVNNKINGFLAKNLSAILPGFVLVPGHDKEDQTNKLGKNNKDIKRSLSDDVTFNIPKITMEKDKDRNSGLKLTTNRIKTSKGRMIKRTKHENGIKRSQQIDKITIANAAIKAFMPFILKSIVQRRMQKQSKKVIYLPMPIKSGDTATLATQNMLPSVPSIGPEPNVPPPPPPKMLPSVPSIGPEPNALPPPSTKLQSSKASNEKNPAQKPKEKNKSEKNRKKSEKEDKKKEDDKKKKNDEKQDDKEKEKGDKQELKKARKGQERHLTPILYPFHLKGMAQMANYKKNEKTETKSNGKGYVLIPHHEEDKTDRTEEYFNHYQD